MENKELRNNSIELGTLDWNIEPLDDGYRTVPIMDSFNWPKLLAEVAEDRGIAQDQYYLVVFRSLRRPGEDNAINIRRLDSAAFQEAKQSAALLHYFAGEVNEEGRAMSWCLWTDAGSARDALVGEAHGAAVRAAGQLYETYDVEFYDVFPDSGQGIVFSPHNRH